RVLLEVLNQALKDLSLLPLRNGEDLRSLLQDHPTKVFNYDGTDREIERNTDQAAQGEEYSGKHKAHTVKNLTLSDDEQYIYYLSATLPGSMHDKAIADQYPIALPEGSVLRQDLGFIGHQPQGCIIEQPYKKPKNKELTFSQKLYNKLLAQLRIKIEHANSGIKRLRILKDTIRLKGAKIRDQIMEVACGLHNLRVRSQQRAYAKNGHAQISIFLE
ncbi:MAG: transposase family protein, partial [Cyanothece sp. SIO2G6]|nr:transposase family protein [Cyanothece sp. SIO2G6]